MKRFFLLLFVLMTLQVKSQTEDEQIQSLEVMIENAEQSGEVLEWTDPGILPEKQSIDLNTCSALELSKLVFLNAAEIQAIIDHRYKTGEYISPLELQTIDILDFEKVKRMMPWVKVKNLTLISDPF